MNHIFDWFFAQYEGVDTHLVVLELIGVVFGFLSVWYSKKENILVYPTGIISTALFVYILWVFGLLGDMLINAYYFSMSIYGWYYWTRKDGNNQEVPVTKATKKEQLWSIIIFILTIIFIIVVYAVNDKFNHWTAYVDTLTTAIFFVGMWLMAKKKLENWTYWIIGDVISVPLYFYKGLIFTSFQYLLFTIIAIYGYKAWKKSLNSNPEIS
ncbi:nicotinamide riboside transporter PnuC [Mangrovimonas sp. AS39]|uniref:nicotinamide riboside transporter PnuC n=1 Tax=Mangrovimonas futianensis TaxID=2895523 RepID=UPI001E5DFF3B|nr:nicotinamide riboside transporter PnuC [Mangrovimonas futianensis]MCF1191126.1 nicotinamide riboside transporter PnuC [Mangrovimonas futianensis]MCF1194821.1 nicotinamide riboside transporter PnuC [Mangrovimonas futianensis]